MSIRAFRVKEIKTEEVDSFSFAGDEKFLDMLEDESDFFSSLGSDGTGVAYVPIKILEKAINTPGIDEYIKQALKNDIEATRKEEPDAEYIPYYCH